MEPRFGLGLTFMVKTNGAPKWREKVDRILEGIDVFFTSEAWPNTPLTQARGQVEAGIMYEPACDPYDKCNVDQRSFRAYLARFMALTVKMAPYTEPLIVPKLRRSAEFAAKRCNGPPGTSGKQCQLKWYQDDWNGAFTGLGEQMAALEVMQSALINDVPAPLTETTGGSSKGDPGAGGSDEYVPLGVEPAATGGRVGAGFLTTFVLFGILGGAWWMVV